MVFAYISSSISYICVRKAFANVRHPASFHSASSSVLRRSRNTSVPSPRTERISILFPSISITCFTSARPTPVNAIIQYYNGGPVGVETLAAAIGEEAVTIEDVVEPYLMQIGFLQRTPRGRCATRAAYLHLGLTPPGTVADDNPRFDV